MVVLKLKTDKEFKAYFNTEEEARVFAKKFLKKNKSWKKGIMREYGYSDSVESFFKIEK